MLAPPVSDSSFTLITVPPRAAYTGVPSGICQSMAYLFEPVTRTVTVGPAEGLDVTEITATRPVWTGCAPPAEPTECLVQLRAHGEVHACSARHLLRTRESLSESRRGAVRAALRSMSRPTPGPCPQVRGSHGAASNGTVGPGARRAVYLVGGRSRSRISGASFLRRDQLRAGGSLVLALSFSRWAITSSTARSPERTRTASI